jgi:hypothetical protein
LIKLDFNMKFHGKVISAVVPSGQERPGRLTCFQSRKEIANGRHRGVNEPGKDPALDAFPFLKTCLKIINLDDCISYRVIIRIIGVCDKSRHWFWNVTSNITPKSAPFEKNNHVLGPSMIRSGTIKNNSDEMCNLKT